MAHSRFMLIVPVFALGILLVGCSKSNGLESGPTVGDSRSHELNDAAPEDGRDVMWWRDESILAELQLTEDQVRAITELMQLARQEVDRLRQQERQLSVGYLRALAQEPYDPALVDRLTERLTAVVSERSRNRVENLRAVRDVVTQEQWTKLWEVAPKALQIGRIRVVRGPKVTVKDGPDPSPTPLPTP